MTGLSYRALPIPHFRTFQKSVFPAYFNFQLLLIVAVATTHPPYSVVSLLQSWDEAVTVGIMLVTSALNWGIWGPRCLLAMIDQAHQGEAEKKQSSERGCYCFAYPEDIRANEW
jgi:hypothetical protein